MLYLALLLLISLIVTINANEVHQVPAICSPYSNRSCDIKYNLHKKDVHSLHRHCGGHNHANLTRPCRNNDTDCGFWVDKWWHPHGCSYRHVTSENARKCVGNRTLACIGDSQIRDICQAVVDLLLGKYDTKDTLKTGKFERGDGAIRPHPEIPSPKADPGYSVGPIVPH